MGIETKTVIFKTDLTIALQLPRYMGIETTISKANNAYPSGLQLPRYMGIETFHCHNNCIWY